jgi:hypothetical protein
MVRDTFPHTARWDSVGLDCSGCVHFRGPRAWPDLDRVCSCARHGLSLAVELNSQGFKDGEWFCTSFEASGRARPSDAVIRHLQSIRAELRADVLYGFYAADGNLKEHEFSELRPKSSEPR